MLNRREALVRLGLLAAGGMLPVVGCATHQNTENNLAADEPDTAGKASIKAFSSSFENVPLHYPETRVRFNKPLPEGLRGTLYRNGPALMRRGEQQYQHWFDGDGMIQAFRLDGQELVHHGRMIETRRFKAESEAGRFLWPGFGTVFPDALSVKQADDMNVANISVLPLDDELLALWEGGSAWKLNPHTLETTEKQVFSPETNGLPFSAHPRTDSTGHIWNFGYMSGSGKLVLYELTPKGTLLRAKLIDAPNADMVHDFAITQRYLVFVLTPVHYQRSDSSEAQSFLQSLHWDGSAPVVVMLVDKHSLQPVRQFEVDSFFAFHFGNAYEDGSTVRIDIARAPAFDVLMKAISLATTGQTIPELMSEQSLHLSLDTLSGKARIEPLPLSGADFPRFDQRYTGQRTSRLFMMGEPDHHHLSPFGLSDLIAYEHQSQNVRHYQYPAHVIAEEHIFVEAPGGAEGVGWVLGTSFDSVAKRTALSVFDSRAVNDGPICTAVLPYHLPLGLHGQFVAS